MFMRTQSVTGAHACLIFSYSFRRGAIAQLPTHSALIDGEVVVIDENGRSDFGRLQRALKSGEDVPRFCAFDLMELDREDIADIALAERKASLSR